MTEKESLIALSSFVAFGPQRLKLLLEYFGNAKNAWSANPSQFQQTGLSPKLVENFNKYRENFRDDYFDRVKNNNINVVTIYDQEYPGKLLQLRDKPILLYVKGNMDLLDKPSIAIVGSRKMSLYGNNMTKRFVSELSEYGFVIISGMARGVDSVAHVSCLDNCGQTIAVLGSGLCRIYPPENESLFDKILSKDGLVISEYPLSYPPLPSNFISRNRIISGLSEAVLVVEGERKSGTLITASHAAEQGRSVFAIPGQIDSPLSGASHFLIQNGAKLVTSTQDIIEELQAENYVDTEEIVKEMEQELLRFVEDEPVNLDDIAKMSSLDSLDVSARLTNMEIKGLVKHLGKGFYKKVES
jgi:DNA processing protein